MENGFSAAQSQRAGKSFSFGRVKRKISEESFTGGFPFNFFKRQKDGFNLYIGSTFASRDESLIVVDLEAIPALSNPGIGRDCPR
jgi:hypothetical protein